MANHSHSTRTPLLPSAGALSPLLPRGAGSQSGPVTKVVRAIRPSNSSTWELRQRESEAEERAAMRALRRRVAAIVMDGIAFLDETGGDPDLEDGADDEPSLGSLGGTASSYGDHGFGMFAETWAGGTLTDREIQNEDGGDINDEPHDPEEDRGAMEDEVFPAPVQFSGYNYHPVSAR